MTLAPALLVALAGSLLQPAPAAPPAPRPGEPTPASTPAPAPAARPSIDLIAFGSCARERKPQPIWTEILATDPDLFLFIGDNHYADFWEKNGVMVMEPIPNIERLHEAYAAMAAHPGFRRMQRHCPILATWDDHDYGANDAGKDFALREESKQVFLDFYGFRDDAPERRQPGVYHARTFGPEGRRVQVIMLDTRFNRDPLQRAPQQADGRRGRYIPSDDTAATILGEPQWRWLEEQLRQPADLRIIASSIQVVSDQHGHETWGNFPHERRRLYDLIDRADAAGVIFLSGDRHLTEISRDPGDAARPAPYPMWDFTSSGMNLNPSPVNEPNDRRVGPVRRETNFGTIRINWADPAGQTTIDLTAHGDQGQILTRQTIFLNDLREPTPR